jgi:hypothetical protein
MKILPFTAAHGRAIHLQHRQRESRTDLDQFETLRALEQEQSFTLMDGGEIVACAGLIDFPGWNGQRKFAWALIAPNPGCRRMLVLTRAIKQFLEKCSIRRIETTVDCDFAGGVIWAVRLGFHCEGRMRMFGRDRRDHFLFARVSD